MSRGHAAASFLGRRRGGTGALCPACLPHYSQSAQSRERFILKHLCVCVCLVCWDTEKGGDNLKDKNGSIKRLQCCDSLSVHTDIHIGTYLYLSSFRVWALQENRGGLSGLEASGQ